LAVVTPFVEGIAFGGLTETQAIDAIAALTELSLQNQGPEFFTVRRYIIDDADIPSDRTFREAWECPAGVIIVNEGKRKVIEASKG